MTEQTFKPGDVVRLKSGSPDMVIIEVNDSVAHVGLWNYRTGAADNGDVSLIALESAFPDESEPDVMTKDTDKLVRIDADRAGVLSAHLRRQAESMKGSRPLAVMTNATSGLDFGQALSLMRAGKVLRREGWRSTHVSICPERNQVINAFGGVCSDLRSADVLATDWEIVQ